MTPNQQNWVDALAKIANASHYYTRQKCPATNQELASVTFECSASGAVAARDHFGDSYGENERRSRKFREWNGDWKKARECLVTGSGDKDRAAEIERRMATIAAGATLTPMWTKDVGGYFPCVADAIGGSPRSMRRKTLKESNSGSMTVFFPLNCSAAVKQHVFTTMMCEIAAALCALSTQRTVQLICYGSLDCKLPAAMRGTSYGDGAFWKIPVNMQYLDARMLAVWADATIGRQVLMQVMRGSGSEYSGNWPWLGFPTLPAHMDLYRAALQANEQDMVIPPICSPTEDVIKIRAEFQRRMEAAGLHMEVK